MEFISLSKFKASFSACLNRARAGQRMLILERGIPIAVLGPLDAVERVKSVIIEEREDMIIEEEIRAGLMRTPKRRLPPEFFERGNMPKDPEGRLLRTLLGKHGETEEI